LIGNRTKAQSGDCKRLDDILLTSPPFTDKVEQSRWKPQFCPERRQKSEHITENVLAIIHRSTI